MVVLASTVSMASSAIPASSFQLQPIPAQKALFAGSVTICSKTSRFCQQLSHNVKGVTGKSCSIRTSAVVADTSQPSSSSDKNQTTQKYYFVVANAKFMLDEEEHFQEQLFERLRYYGERNLEQDFWLVIEPKFLEKFPSITKRLKRPAVALVSTNGPWITFMKLRLDRVLAESYEADSLEEALASIPTEIEFEKPQNWVAPYPKYESGWWESFLPPGSQKPEA